MWPARCLLFCLRLVCANGSLQANVLPQPVWYTHFECLLEANREYMAPLFRRGWDKKQTTDPHSMTIDVI